MKNDEAAILYPVLAVPLEPKILEDGSKPEVPPKPSYGKPEVPPKPSYGKPEVPPKPSFFQTTSHPPPFYPSVQQQIQPSSEVPEECRSTNNEPQNTTVPSMPPPTPPRVQALIRLPPMSPKTATTSVYASNDESIANFSEQQELIPPTQPNSTLEKFYFSLLILILILCLIIFGLLLAVYFTM